MSQELSLVAEGKNAIVKGSKSFSMASFFFSPEEKHAAWLLYSWCRFVDDEIDGAGDLQLAQIKVQEVRRRTVTALQDPESESGPYRSLGLIAQKYQIPALYPLDLIRGMQMDVEGANIQDEAQLMDYCYCVAGTVGLMMCSIMGVSSDKALKHALAMGQAMQLTNMARDVAEDLRLERIYFPRTWLADQGLSEETFANAKSDWIPLVQKFLDRAEVLYREGFVGLRYLSFRAAWAVIIAAFIYRDIGRKIQKNIPQSFDQRVYTSKWDKVCLVMQASFMLLMGTLLSWRFLRPSLEKTASSST